MQHTVTPRGSALQDKMVAKHLHGMKKQLDNVVEEAAHKGCHMQRAASWKVPEMLLGGWDGPVGNACVWLVPCSLGGHCWAGGDRGPLV